MSARDSVPPAESALGAQLFANARSSRGAAALGWGIALLAHVAVASWAVGERHAASRAPAPLEVELAAPEPLPPAPPTPAPPATAPAEHAPAPVAKAAAAAPAAAHVGALLTAKSDPTSTPGADEPVDFTNDPSLIGFGSGVVAIGGKAEHGVTGAKAGPAVPSTGVGSAPKPSGDELVAASDLSRKPGLGENDPCRGYFPAGANDDVATAAVMVTIAKSGSVTNVQLLSETPPKQGFGAAARTCMAGKHFSPGLDRDGKPAATAIRVNIRFLR
ncbi:MAG TPA: hypothetical protein VHB79_03240 [Polyangiaceae bacterium]|nr:hypothetical protein [Polyangiaceae bacterium]